MGQNRCGRKKVELVLLTEESVQRWGELLTHL